MASTRRILWASLTIAGLLAAAACAWILRTPAPPPVGKPAPAGSQRQRQAFEVAEVIHDGSFGKGWEDWGWGPRGGTDGGVLRVGFAGYGGVIFHHEALTARFGALVFRFRAPQSYGDFLSVSLMHNEADEKVLPVVAIDARHTLEQGGGWREVLVPWLALNPGQGPFDRIVIKARDLVQADWVEIDKVVLTKPSAEQASNAPVRPTKLSIDCRAPATAISPMIYGVSKGPPSLGATAYRIGGNRLTRHNWDRGATNTGSDWFFENVDEGEGPFEWLKSSRRDQTKTAIVVPTIGWVAKDEKSVGFPASKLGKQSAHDPHRAEAGNGIGLNGKPIAPGPPTETSVAAPPEQIRGWIEKLRRDDQSGGGRAVDIYILDNEPDLWHATHRDVHPEPLTYDELLDRTIRYGTAIRTADPEALIAGPASWGWPGYFYSPLDLAGGSLLPHPDSRRHGGVPLLVWYLMKLAEHERRTGTRVLDVLDVHFYPQADGICQGGARTDPATSALRLRSTRSLWDPSYRDESWINDNVKLVPRLKDWVQKNYPGRSTMLGEWSFCAEEHISGGLAIAEALGRFGQHGLTSAFFWGALETDTPAFWAYRAYRNFDGKGARFLDFSLPTRDAESVSLFASRDQESSRLVVIVLNLDADSARDVEIDISSCGRVSSQRLFGYGRGASGLSEKTVPLSAEKSAGKLLGGVVPPYSLRVIEAKLEMPASP